MLAIQGRERAGVIAIKVFYPGIKLTDSIASFFKFLIANIELDVWICQLDAILKWAQRAFKLTSNDFLSNYKTSYKFYKFNFKVSVQKRSKYS